MEIKGREIIKGFPLYIVLNILRKQKKSPSVWSH